MIYAGISMTRKKAILIMESLPEPLSKMFQKIGYVPCAAQRKMTFHL